MLAYRMVCLLTQSTKQQHFSALRDYENAVLFCDYSVRPRQYRLSRDEPVPECATSLHIKLKKTTQL